MFAINLSFWRNPVTKFYLKYSERKAFEETNELLLFPCFDRNVLQFILIYGLFIDEKITIDTTMSYVVVFLKKIMKSKY